jgi:hypothetical protein
MSNIPYTFFALPTEFLTDEYTNDPASMKFIHYVMKRIRPYSQVVRIKSNGWHNIELGPFEFIFGREQCSKETGLTESQVRTRMNRMIASSFASRIASSSTRSFTVYRLTTGSFKQNTNYSGDQPNRQQFRHKEDNKSKTCSVLSCSEPSAEKEKNTIVIPNKQDPKKFYKESHENIFSHFRQENYRDVDIKEAITRINSKGNVQINTEVIPYLQGVLNNFAKKQSIKQPIGVKYASNNYGQGFVTKREEPIQASYFYNGKPLDTSNWDGKSSIFTKRSF